MRRLSLLPCFCLAFLAAPVAADEVQLEDGSKVVGKIILDKKDGPLFVQLANKGVKVLERADVREVVQDEARSTYARFHRYSDAWSRLEVLTRTLQSADGSRQVSLVGAIHVADKRYYGRVQKILDRHDAVLYEGVGPNQDRLLAEAALPDAEQRALELAKPFEPGVMTWSDVKSKDSITIMQTTMANSLELTYQRDGVDYSHSWWFSADVSQAELEGMFANGKEAAMLDSLVKGMHPQQQAQMNSLVGRTLAAAAKGLLGPKSMQLVLKEACADLLASQFQLQAGLDSPGKAMSDFDRAIILGRNRVVMDRFKEIEKHPTAKTVAIFYGAAHNPDLEAQLAELGYTPIRDEWLPAWVMEPKPEPQPR